MKTIPFSHYTGHVNGKRSIEEALAELEREIAVRRRIFDDWTAKGKISWMDGHDRLERMLSALTHLLHYSMMLDAAHEPDNNTATPPESLLSPETLDRTALEPAF